MARFKDAPVFTIDESKLAELQKNGTPEPVVEKKYKSGTIYLTRNYPGYEGTAVYLGVSDSHRGDGGRVRVTGELPAIPPRMEQILSTCPNCAKRFPEGALIIPGSGAVRPVEIDHTHTEAEFEKFLSDLRATVSSGG